MRKHLDKEVKDKTWIWDELLKSENRARAPRVKKFSKSPFKYPLLLFFDYFLYPLTKKGIYIKAATFFSIKMKTLLPSGTDILLNKIKSHDSEIRLSKYLVRELKEGDVFIDVGAHYGYYSLLASALLGENAVYSIEPSSVSFKLLKENTFSLRNVSIYHAAASSQHTRLTFYEYPGPLSEYNTTIKDAYVNEKWAKKIQPIVTTVDTMIIDELITENHIEKACIKIDVEGGEAEVIKGMADSLSNKRLTVIMEYLITDNSMSPHFAAAEILSNAGYEPLAIQVDGKLERIDSIESYMKTKDLKSDNIVFIKSK